MRKHQRGSILLEIVVILILMAAVGPLIYQSRVRKMNELEAMNIAGQMSSVGRGLERYIQANFTTLALGVPSGGDAQEITLDADFTKFLPRGINLNSSYLKEIKVAIRRDVKAGEFMVSGIVLGPNKMRSRPIPDLLGNQISAMIGQSGGFVPSTYLNAAGKTAHGSGGFWTVDLTTYFPAVDPNRFPTSVVYKLDLTASQIAQVTDTKNQIIPMSTDDFYLSRVQKVDGSGDYLNRMAVLLDMGGNTLKNVGAVAANDDLMNVTNFRFITLSGGAGIDLQGNSDRKTDIHNVGSVSFTDANGNRITVEDRKLTARAYTFDLNADGVSAVKEITVGGKNLKDVLPGVMLKDIKRGVRDADLVAMPTCPSGYVPLIELVPQNTKTFCEEIKNINHPKCTKKTPAAGANAYLEEVFQTPLIVPKYSSCRPLKYFRTAANTFGETGNVNRLPIDGAGNQTFNFQKTSESAITKMTFAPQLGDYSAAELSATTVFEKLPNFDLRVHGALSCITPLKDKEGYLTLHDKECNDQTVRDYTLDQDFKILETEVILEGTSGAVPKVSVCRIYVPEANAKTQSFIDTHPPIKYDSAGEEGKQYYYLTDKTNTCDAVLPKFDNLNRKVVLKQRDVLGTSSKKYFEKEVCKDTFTFYTGSAPDNTGPAGKYWEYFSVPPAGFEKMLSADALRVMKGVGKALTRYDVFMDENRNMGNGTPIRTFKKVPVLGTCTDYGAAIADISSSCGTAVIDIPGYSCTLPDGRQVDDLTDKYTSFKLAGEPYTCITQWVDVEDGNEKTATYARRLVDTDNVALAKQAFEASDVGGTMKLSAEIEKNPATQEMRWRINALGVETMDARIYCRQDK